MMRRRTTLAFAALLFPATAAAQEQIRSGQSVTLAGSVVEIFDVSGNVTMRRGSGSVTVRPTAQGADAGRLAFFVDRSGERAVFRVQLPEDVEEMVAPAGRGFSGRTTVHVRPDGTFGGDDGYWPGEGGSRRRGARREIEVGGRRGLRAWADLEITVPANAVVKLHLAVGVVEIDGVEGDVFIDTWSASATASNIAGTWLFDTGSGDVEVRGMRGTLRIDTGSGNGTVSAMRGDVLDIDTGSGNVEVSDAQIERCRFDTGSGDVRATGLTARRCVADTGSGGVTIEYAGGAVDDLLIDTGSGSADVLLPPNPDVRITVDVGSGGINVMRAGGMLEHRSRTELAMTFGQGRGRVRIDTGSGSATIR
jgi:predicted aspartyl protease